MPCIRHGQRLCGEWLIQAHGLRYAIAKEPSLFRPFDIMEGPERLPWRDFYSAVKSPLCLVYTVSEGSTSLDAAMKEAAATSIGVDEVEGVVYRVESAPKNSSAYKFEFAAKYVRHDKVDGQYLPEISGKPPVWNWPPEEFLKW